MSKYEKIGRAGATHLFVLIITTKMLVSAPALYVKTSGSAGWLEVLMSGVFEVFILTIIFKLMSAFADMDFIDIGEYAFGKTGRIGIGLIGLFVCIISAAVVIRSYCEIIRNTVIRGISYETIAFFIVVAGAIGAYLGIRTLVDMCSLILPFILLSLAVIILINISNYSFTNITPVLGVGIGDVVKNAVFKNASFYELGIFLFLYPYMKDSNSVKQSTFTGIISSVLLLSIITLLYQMAVPYETAGEFSFPLYQMTRMIRGGNFFQRMEPLNTFIWSGSMFVYVGIALKMSAHIFKRTFRLSEGRPLIYIFAFISCILALIPGSQIRVTEISEFIMTYAYIVYPILPLATLVLALACSRKKRGENS